MAFSNTWNYYDFNSNTRTLFQSALTFGSDDSPSVLHRSTNHLLSRLIIAFLGDLSWLQGFSFVSAYLPALFPNLWNSTVEIEKHDESQQQIYKIDEDRNMTLVKTQLDSTLMIIALTWTSIQIIRSSTACIVMQLLGTDENGTRFVQEDLERVESASMCPSNAVLTLGFSDTRYTERNVWLFLVKEKKQLCKCFQFIE